MKRSLTTLVVAALVGLAAAGCSSSTTSTGSRASQTGGATPTASAPAASNGTATMSAAQATGAAIKALTAAKTVRITGTFADPETHRSGQLDMWVTGTSGRGTMGEQGAKIAMILCNGKVYFKASADALKVMTKGQGIPAGVMDLMAGRWFKVGSVQASQLPVLTISALTAEMSQLIVSDSHATVSTGTFAGQPVTIVSYRDGSRLYIAATGPARPLRLDMPGSDGGHFLFSGYGVPVTVTPPQGALDVGQMGQ